MSFKKYHNKIISSSWFLAKKITLILAIIPFIFSYLICCSIFLILWVVLFIPNKIRKLSRVKQWVGAFKVITKLKFYSIKVCNALKIFILKLYKILKELKNLTIDYVIFIIKLYSNFPIRFNSAWFIVLLTYLYTLKLIAMNSLLGIDRGFFTLDSIELKLWDGFFTLLDLMMSSNILYIIITMMYIAIMITSPFYLIEAFKKAKTEKPQETKLGKVFMTLTPWVIVTYMAIMILLTTILMFLNISGNISIGIMEYYLNNTQFCDVYYHKKNAPLQLSIIDNYSVPYKLVLQESEIFYFKPNESLALWHKFTESEERHIKKLCLHKKAPDK